MTALVTTNSLARPLSFAVAWPLTPTFLVVAAGIRLAAIVFVVGTREPGGAAVEHPA